MAEEHTYVCKEFVEEFYAVGLSRGQSKFSL